MRTRMLVAVRNKTKTTNVFVFEDLPIKFYGEKNVQDAFRLLYSSKRTTKHSGLHRSDLMTEDSTLLCSASDTVCRAMASLAAICFFFRLFRLWDGDHSWLNTNTGSKRSHTPRHYSHTIPSPCSSTVWSRSRIVINMEI